MFSEPKFMLGGETLGKSVRSKQQRPNCKTAIHPAESFGPFVSERARERELQPFLLFSFFLPLSFSLTLSHSAAMRRREKLFFLSRARDHSSEIILRISAPSPTHSRTRAIVSPEPILIFIIFAFWWRNFQLFSLTGRREKPNAALSQRSPNLI